MRKHASTMILILILVVGLSLMLYPSFSNWWNEAHRSRAIAAYSQEVSSWMKTAMTSSGSRPGNITAPW